MDRDEKLSQLMQESRLKFLSEEREKIKGIMITLLDYRIHRGEEQAYELERFFHSLKGTGSTLQFEELSSIGEEYEDYFREINRGKGLSERFFLKLLDGLARVHESLEKLFLQHNGEVKTDEKAENLDSVASVAGSVQISDNNTVDGYLMESEFKKVIEAKRRILLVDDVSVIVHLIEMHLGSKNYEVISARDGEEGLRKCKKLKPDLMLVDLILPKLDGFELCRKIKNDPETKDIKIIILSSKNSKEDVLKCYEAGADDYMVKPFSMSELEQRVNNILKVRPLSGL